MPVHRKLFLSLYLHLCTLTVSFVAYCTGQSWAEPGGLVSLIARACGARLPATEYDQFPAEQVGITCTRHKGNADNGV